MQIRRRHRPVFKKDAKFTRVNMMIRIPEVQLIDENGEFIGTVSTSVALRRAQEAGLDLVEVDPTQRPSTARIMDWGQMRYEREKKERKAKAKQKKTEVKSIRLSFRIKGQDLENRKDQALKFLEDGNLVKCDIVLRGRERAHKGLAIENLKKFAQSLGEGVAIISPVATMGGTLSITVGKKS